MVQERPVRVERRLSAILAADMAGYSRLMHNDEETTHAKLTALLADGVAPAIAEHGGRIVKHTGDGFLAEFPSAVQAVRAAIQFQSLIKELAIDEVEDRRIAFRVGVNIGDVIVEAHDIFGDGVNIAARLESIAEPGGICISFSAYDQVRAKVGVEFIDLFDMQDEIVSRLANTLDAQLIEVEARRAGRSTDPDAMDLYFQGWARANNGTTEEYMTQAEAFFDRSLALDPGNIEALVGSARVKAAIGANLTRDDWTAQFAAAEAAVIGALSLAPNHARAHSVLGFVQTHTSRPIQGIAECERALALDRNLADAHGFIGLAKYFLARGEETEGHIHEAFRLSPRDNNAYRWLMFVGLAKLSLGADAEAVAWLRRSIEANRNHPVPHWFLAAALSFLGSRDEARAAAQAGLVLNPTFTIRRYLARATSHHPSLVAARKRTS